MTNRLFVLLSLTFVLITSMPSHAMQIPTLANLCIDRYHKHIKRVLNQGIKNKLPSSEILVTINQTMKHLPEELLSNIMGPLIQEWASKKFSSCQNNYLLYDGRQLSDAQMLHPTNKIGKCGEGSLWSTLSFDELITRYITVHQAKKAKSVYPYKLAFPIQSEKNRSISPCYDSPDAMSFELDSL